MIHSKFTTRRSTDWSRIARKLLARELMEGSSSFCDLSEDVVVEEILSRLPIEQLIKCRYVSKLWKNRFIPQVLLSQQKPKPTFGLIVRHSTMNITDGTPVKLSLVRRIEEDEQRSVGGGGGGEYIQAIPNLFSLSLDESEVLSSCNGLLLFWIREAETTGKPRTIYYFYVCNPVLNQWVALPQPKYSLRRSPDIGFAAYDTTIDDHQGHHQAAAQQHHYKVVHFYFEKTYLLETKMIPCEIFSSETGEWRHHQARLISTSSICSDIAFRILERYYQWLMTSNNPHLYHKGVIYWKFNWDNYLLLFLLEDEVFKLIPLPDDPEYGFKFHDMWGPSLLWESKGCIYYLWATASQLQVWAYLGSTKEDEEWVLKHVVKKQTLIPQMPPESILSIGMDRLHTFDADLQVLYLPMRGEIFSYNFETKKLTALRTYKYENNAGGDKGDLVPLTGLGNVIPYRFTLFDLPTWDGCKVLRPKLSADKTCLLTRSLFNLPT